MSKKTKGVVYIATQEPYLSEAVESAKSVRGHHPELGITLFKPQGEHCEKSPFDDIQTIQTANDDFSDTILKSKHLVYDNTLFLDTDTYVAAPIGDVFKLLDRFEMAVAHDPSRTGTVDHEATRHVPDSYPQFNTGVLALRDTESVHEFLHYWKQIYEQTKEAVHHGLNQPAFRLAAYTGDIGITTLPPEYNYRQPYYGLGYASGTVKIVHTRSAFYDLDTFAKSINANTGPRVFTTRDTPIELITQADKEVHTRHMINKTHTIYQRNGLRSMIRKLASVLVHRVSGR